MLRALLVFLSLTVLATVRAAGESPSIAVAPAVLETGLYEAPGRPPVGGALAERIALSLQNDPALGAHHRFVERDRLEILLGEQSLSLSGLGASVSMLRAGHLARADWLLRLRLHTAGPAGAREPRITAEVVETLRASVLGRADAPLSAPPLLRQLVLPDDADVELARSVALRALDAANENRRRLAGRTVVAPLALINRGGPRLAPLSDLFFDALAEDHPACRVLAFEDTEAADAESLLFHAGLTDRTQEEWARVADVYAWGEYNEEFGYSGPAENLPVLLSLQLWRGGDEPRALEFRGTLGSLETLARQAARATLDLSTGGRVDSAVAPRRRIADRLMKTAHAVVENTPDPHKRDRDPFRRHLVGLASFFAPEDASLREELIRLNCLQSTHQAKERWEHEFWAFFDQHFLAPDGRPDLALIARAAKYPVHAPGAGSRFEKIGAAWRGAVIDEQAALELWKGFVGFLDSNDGGPEFIPAVEALWPTLRRIDPELAPAAPETSIGTLQALSRVYRDQPRRLARLLSDRLIPAAPAPLRPSLPTAAAAPVSAAPASPGLPGLDLAEDFVKIQRSSPTSLLERAKRSPLAAAPELEAATTPLDLVGLTPPDLKARSLQTALFVRSNPHADDIWMGFRSENWWDLRSGRLSIAPPAWSPATPWIKSPDQINDLWFENANTVWIASSTAGLSLVELGRKTRREFGPDQGLPGRDIKALLPGHDALFLQMQRAGGIVPRITLADRSVGQISLTVENSGTWPSPALRAAIESYPDDLPPRAKLPDEPAVYLDEALIEQLEHGPSRSSARSDPVPIFALNSNGGDPRHSARYIPTAHRDGYWTGFAGTVEWRSGRRRVAIAAWIRHEISHLIDDGRRLFVAVAATGTRNPRPVNYWIYDYQEGRWLGRIALGSKRWISAGQGRLVLGPTEGAPAELLDPDALRPKAIQARRSTPSPSVSTIKTEARVAAAREQWERNQRARREKRDREQRYITALRANPPDLEALKTSLAEGCDPTGRADGTSPVLIAADAGNFTAVEFLLPLLPPAEFSNIDRNGAPPVGAALLRALIKKNQSALALRVIAAGYDPRPAHDKELGELAILAGAAELTIRLRERSFPLTGYLVQKPLRIAVAQQNLPLLQALLARPPAGAEPLDPNDSTGDGRSALFAAVSIGWIDGVRAMLAAGASANDCEHATGLHLSDVAAAFPEVAMLLNGRRGAPDNQPAGAEAVAAIVTGSGPPPPILDPAVTRYRDFGGNTALHRAVSEGRRDWSERLIDSGAALDVLNNTGLTPLACSVAAGDATLAARLLQAGAGPGLSAPSGWSPLHRAAFDGRDDLAGLLLDAGAPPDRPAGDARNTPLFLAVRSPRGLPIARRLLAAGAALDTLDSDGFGVLENAVLSDSPSLIQYLLDHGAKWRAPFDDSYHPMDTAARRSLTGSIRQLQRLGLASPRALSLATDPVVIAILQDDQSDNGRRFLADETNWPLVLEEPDPSRRLPRVAAHVEAGGNLNHPSQLWRSPLSYALLKNDPALARWMIDRGARPGDKVLLFPPDGGWQQGTALRRWFASQRRLKPDETADPVADEVAVAYLELLWKHESSSASRGDMLRWAKNAGLTRAAAWINEHL